MDVNYFWDEYFIIWNIFKTFPHYRISIWILNGRTFLLYYTNFTLIEAESLSAILQHQFKEYVFKRDLWSPQDAYSSTNAWEGTDVLKSL